MSRYPLEDLVRVRRLREEQAGQAVTRARRVLEEAKAAVVKAEQELRDYAIWRKEEEKRRLDALMRRALRLGELTDVRQEITELREREFEFMDRVRQAEAAVVKAQEALDAARARHAKAVRELEKLLEHRTTWLEADTRERERVEEVEMEEFSGATARDEVVEV